MKKVLTKKAALGSKQLKELKQAITSTASSSKKISQLTPMNCGPVDGDVIIINKKEAVNHPVHYGGKHNTYEAVKVIEAWGLNFNLGNTAKYISRAGKKGDKLEDLKKAAWYLNREIENLQK